MKKMKMFVWKRSWRALELFGDEEREYEEMGAVEAESLEDARDRIIGRTSVLALEAGVTLRVLEVHFKYAQVWHAQYDGPPLDDGHNATRAKLTVVPAS